MKLLENIFLVLTIIVPTFFVIIYIYKLDRVKKNKKYRKRLLKYIMVSLVLNGIIFGGLKVYNVKTSKEENKSHETTDKKDESGEEQKTNQEKPTTKPTDPTDPTEPPKPPKVDTPTTGNTTSKGFKIETKDGVTYIDGFLVVNKTYPLPETYVPTGTHKKVSAEICQECIVEEAYTAFSKMKADAKNLGLNIWIQSGYRSYSYQGGLYNGYVKRSGKEAADTFSARPGHSEHQSGYAFDLNTITDAFASTKEGIWVNENCFKYGFIIRYPKGKENETGYKYESWHLRYVGVDLASKLYNAGDWITMEDHFGITSKYEN